MPCCGFLKSSKPKRRKLNIVVVGIDNAGKSTLVTTLQRDIDTRVVPTIGFNMSTVKHGDNCDVTVFDVGGGPRIRAVWETYYPESHGIIYVVDSADPKHVAESKAVFNGVLEHGYAKDKPIAVMANKQDLPGAMPEVDISVALGIDKLGCPHTVQQCVAKPTDSGEFDSRVQDAFDWLIDAIDRNFEALDARVKEETAIANKARDERNARAAREREEAAKQTEEKAAEADADEDADDSAPKCDVCKSRPATSRAAVSKWMPVCDPCKEALEKGEEPPIPKPASDAIQCKVCNAADAVQKAMVNGEFLPVCEGCTPAPAMEAEEESKGDQPSAAPAAAPEPTPAAGAEPAAAEQTQTEKPKPHELLMSGEEAAEAAPAAQNATLTLPGGISHDPSEDAASGKHRV